MKIIFLISPHLASPKGRGIFNKYKFMKNKINSLFITKNKKAYFDYEILDSWEAGIELKWYEAKSIRAGHVNLKW